MNTHPARPQPAVLLIFLLLAGVLAIAGFALWKNPSAQTPQYTVRSSAPSLMLEQPVNELPAVDEFAWNDWANQSSWAALLVWLVALFVLLLAGLPLAVLIFARWHDAGAAWARIISLLLVGYAVWLPTSLGVCFFSRISLAVAFGALLLLDVLIVMWMGGIRIFLGHIRRCGWSMLISETLFLAGFLLFALLRAHNPDLWHPIWGGEKPMEFAFLNAILRSPVMPPYDPFFSDGTINYYYYGLYLVALPIKATGITSSIAFNLVIPTLFALTLSGGYAIVRQLTGRVRYGLAGGAFLALLGNMASVVKTGWSQGMEPVYHALLQPGSETWTERLSHLGTRLGDWYIGPSRVITEPFFTINEFPFWSFLFADLHPHLIALPIALLVIALIALVAGVGRKGTRVTPFAFLLLALALGTLAVTNSWDFPTYALLMGIALVGSAWRSPRRTAGDGGGSRLAPRAAGRRGTAGAIAGCCWHGAVYPLLHPLPRVCLRGRARQRVHPHPWLPGHLRVVSGYPAASAARRGVAIAAAFSGAPRLYCAPHTRHGACPAPHPVVSAPRQSAHRPCPIAYHPAVAACQRAATGTGGAEGTVKAALVRFHPGQRCLPAADDAGRCCRGAGHRCS